MKNLKRVTGIYNGTAAAVYLCVGAVPNYAKLINLSHGTYPYFIEWYMEMMGQVAGYGGINMIDDTGIYTYATTDGIRPYHGGDMLTADTQTSTAYGEGVYLGWDLKDYRADKAFGTNGAAISKWTNDGTVTGHFNADGVASVCRIGVGSIIRIKEDLTGIEKEASITALTSTPTFTTSTYVSLSRAIKTGSVTFIGGQYTLSPIAIGKVTPAGIYLGDTAGVNQNNHTVMFDMWWEI